MKTKHYALNTGERFILWRLMRVLLHISFCFLSFSCSRLEVILFCCDCVTCFLKKCQVKSTLSQITQSVKCTMSSVLGPETQLPPKNSFNQQNCSASFSSTDILMYSRVIVL